MLRRVTGLHLPALHSSYSRRRDRFDLGPTTEHDLRIRRAPAYSVRAEDDNGIGNLERDAVAGRSRCSPPRSPAACFEMIDAERVAAERDARAGRVGDGAVLPDGQCS